MLTNKKHLHLFYQRVICLLMAIVGAYSDNTRTIFFRINTEVSLGFKNQISSDVSFIINANFYLAGSRDLDYPYEAAFYNVTVLRKDKNIEDLNFSTCHSFDEFLDTFEIPFLIDFDTFYVINGLKFNDNESELSKNLKFTYATYIYQIDVDKLMGTDEHEFVTYANETTVLGHCKVKYNVHKIKISEDITDCFVSKDYNNQSCIKNMNTGGYTLGEICNTDKTKNFQIKLTNKREVQLNKTISTIQTTRITDERSFIPWKGSSKEFDLSIKTYVKHEQTLNQLPKSEVVNTDSKLVKNLSFSYPKKSYIIGPEANKVDMDLREIYKALSCDSTIDTTFREFIEEVIKCEIDE